MILIHALEIVLSEEKNYNGLMLKELDWCESCDTEREREREREREK